MCIHTSLKPDRTSFYTFVKRDSVLAFEAERDSKAKVNLTLQNLLPSLVEVVEYEEAV